MALSRMEMLRVQRSLSDAKKRYAEEESRIKRVRIQREISGYFAQLGIQAGGTKPPVEPEPVPDTELMDEKDIAALKRREAKKKKLKEADVIPNEFNSWTNAMAWAKQWDLVGLFYPKKVNSQRSKSGKWQLHKLPEKPNSKVMVYYYQDDGTHDGNFWYITGQVIQDVYAYALSITENTKLLDKAPEYALPQFMGGGDSEGVMIDPYSFGKLVKAAGLSIFGGTYEQTILDEALAEAEEAPELEPELEPEPTLPPMPEATLIERFMEGEFKSVEKDEFIKVMRDVSAEGISIDALKAGANEWLEEHQDLFAA